MITLTFPGFPCTCMVNNITCTVNGTVPSTEIILDVLVLVWYQGYQYCPHMGRVLVSVLSLVTVLYRYQYRYWYGYCPLYSISTGKVLVRIPVLSLLWAPYITCAVQVRNGTVTWCIRSTCTFTGTSACTSAGTGTGKGAIISPHAPPSIISEHSLRQCHIICIQGISQVAVWPSFGRVEHPGDR